MNVPSATSLLQEFDALHHDGRMQRIGQLAQQFRQRPELDRLISELEAGETFNAYLAVHLAALTGRAEPLMRALASDSVLVKETAAKALPKIGADKDTLLDAYTRSVPALRRSLRRHIIRHGRSAAAEALFARVLAEEGPFPAVGLLSACGQQTVKDALAQYGYAVQNWRQLAVRHPGVVLALFRQRLEAASPQERRFVWTRYRGAVEHLYLDHAQEIARLALEFGPTDQLPGVIRKILGGLARRAPQLTFEIVTSPANYAALQQQGIPRELQADIRQMTPEHRRAFARILTHAPTHLAALLGALPPAERGDLFAHARAETDAARAPWNEALLEVLPHPTRHAEARRILAREDIRADRLRGRRLSAYLPFDEARPLLEEAARSPDAEERAAALHALTHCAGLNRRGIGPAIAFCQKIENDQDPVRLAVYQALLKCPPNAFMDAQADDLFRLLGYAFDARDTSWQTRACIEKLSISLLQAHATRPNSQLFSVALNLIKALAKQSTHLWLELEHRLPRGAEKPLIDALEPHLRDATQREDYALLFLFARALGRRAWDAEIIQSLLKRATRAKPDPIAHTAIDLWLASPQTRDARVVALLARDSSNIRLNAVFAHVHRRRQDLLDPHLKRRPILGRLMSGKTVYLLPARDGFFRWLPRQQRAFRDLIDAVINDTGATTWTRSHLMRVRAALPISRLEEFVGWTQSAEIIIAEAALHSASRLDRPAHAAALLCEHLQSSRARVAIYSMTRPANYMAPADLHGVLTDILGREHLKITVLKETMRLLSRFPSPDNIALLFEYARHDALHVDVKLACGGAARGLLHLEQAWQILERLAADENPHVVLSLLNEDVNRFSASDAARYLGLVARAGGHADPLVRAGVSAALGRWARVDPPKVATICAAYITDLDATNWTQALQSLWSAVQHGDVQDTVIAAAQSLLERPIDDQPEARDGRDLPARQRLAALVGRLTPGHAKEAARLRPLLMRLDTDLAQDPTLLALRIALRLNATRWPHPQLAHDDLRHLVDDLRDTWIPPTELSRRLALHLTSERVAPNESALRALSLELGEAASPGLRLLGVSLLSVLGPRLSWPEELVTALCKLRRDADVGVRAAACEIFVFDERR